MRPETGKRSQHEQFPFSCDGFRSWEPVIYRPNGAHRATEERNTLMSRSDSICLMHYRSPFYGTSINFREVLRGRRYDVRTLSPQTDHMGRPNVPNSHPLTSIDVIGMPSPPPASRSFALFSSDRNRQNMLPLNQSATLFDRFDNLPCRRGGRKGRWWIWLGILVVVALIHDAGFFTAVTLNADESPVATAADAISQSSENNEDGSTVSNTGQITDETHGKDHTGKQHAGDDHGGGHADPVSPVLLAIVLILFFAKVFGHLFEKFGLPAVLGELIVGILLGNCLFLTGWEGLEFLKVIDENHVAPSFHTGNVLKMLGGIGAVLLLFEVGLESSVHEMRSVGMSSFLVAILGVIAPMGLGYGVTYFVLQQSGQYQGWEVPAFVGATLCATSVGITARVLKDLGQSERKESKIILGAAVVDDVLGLVVLAVVSGVITQAATGGEGSLAFDVTKIVVLAFGFLAGALILGFFKFPRLIFRLASFLRGHGLLVASALVICFSFAWFSNFIGLAPIVGAFAAGLILENAHYQELGERENRELEEALEPISSLLVPIFFVQMGIEVDLSQLGSSEIWLLAIGITVAAIIGKQVCSFGVMETGLNKTAVGLGMIPRGEVGLIFAGVGKELQDPHGGAIINDSTYAAVIVMVMVTTVVTPPLLKWSLLKGQSPGSRPDPDNPESVTEQGGDWRADE